MAVARICTACKTKFFASPNHAWLWTTFVLGFLIFPFWLLTAYAWRARNRCRCRDSFATIPIESPAGKAMAKTKE